MPEWDLEALEQLDPIEIDIEVAPGARITLDARVRDTARAMTFDEIGDWADYGDNSIVLLAADPADSLRRLVVVATTF